MNNEPEWRLAELAERSGVSPRTIRLYIAKGLVAPPLRAGRDAAYGPMHLEALLKIREEQRKGLTLDRIRLEMNEGREGVSILPEPGPWWEYPVAPDVRVSVRGGTSGMRLKRIREAIALLQEHLSESGASKKEELER
jgi:DNA-binding transcriptional MerR regulator